MFDKGMAQSTEANVVGIIFAVVLFGALGLGVADCGGGTSPMDKANNECEQAWVDANDGEDDDEVPALYNEPWCQQHNTTKRQVQEMEQQQEVTEQFQEDAAVTVTEVLNGTRERAIADARAGMSRAEIAARYSMSDGWAGKVIRASGRTRRNGAAPAVPAVGANSTGEARPLARSNGTVPKPVTSVKARRQRHLIVVMWVVAGIVACAVGTLSYSLIQTLAEVAGTGWHAYIVPVALDGMYLCGAICLAIDPKYLPAKLAIGIGVVASMATGWIAAADPASVVDLELAARTLMSVTPLTLLLCVAFILHAYKVRK